MTATVTADVREAARLIRELDKIEGRKTDSRVEAIADSKVVPHNGASAKPRADGQDLVIGA
jgi:hypothetical protein